METTSGSRRPIASRDSGWAKTAASVLARHKVTPNFISLLSIAFSLLSLVSFYLDYTTHSNHILYMALAIIGIQGRLIMNLLDGMVAIEHDKKSVLGGLYNEVPDRVSDTLILLGAGIAIQDMSYGMDMAYVAVILSMATAYIRTLGGSLGAPHFFLGPMAKQQRMALITVGCIIAIGYVPIFYYFLIIMNIGLVITCYRRLAKIASYLKNENLLKSN